MFPDVSFGSHPPGTGKKIGGNIERNSKISAKKIEWWKDRKGSTVEQIFGLETGSRIRRLKSERYRGKGNPAYGKVYPRVGRKLGRYKGLLFRSLYELSFLKFLEQQGICITDPTQLQYEFCTIEYDLEGHRRTYHPDFLCIPQRTVYEVKCRWDFIDLTRKKMLDSKIESLSKYCQERSLLYRIVTEENFTIIKESNALNDPEVVFIKR